MTSCDSATVDKGIVTLSGPNRSVCWILNRTGALDRSGPGKPDPLKWNSEFIGPTLKKRTNGNTLYMPIDCYERIRDLWKGEGLTRETGWGGVQGGSMQFGLSVNEIKKLTSSAKSKRGGPES